jgi:5-methylcytosine-specific restriction endonuclease McrA
MQVLLLNASCEPLTVVSWQRAATIFFQGKARPPANDIQCHSIGTVRGAFLLPVVLMLVEYVKVPFKRAAVSKENVLRRDGHACQYCGKRLTNRTGTIDHILPQSRGGKHAWANVTASCINCNNSKDNRTPAEANMKLRRQPFVPSWLTIMIGAVEESVRNTWKEWMLQ